MTTRNDRTIDIVREQTPKVTRIETFYSLQSGQYWKAIRDVPNEAITAGTVLLIESVRWVDDDIHTIILRPHPSVYGQTAWVESVDSAGSKYRSLKKFTEHRFLTDDFLSAFEFEPDFERIRTQEVAKARSTIDALQADLLQAQQDPTVLATVVDNEVKRQAETAAAAMAAQDPSIGLPARAPSAASQDLADLSRNSLSGVLQSGITPDKIGYLRAAAEREHQVATTKATWIRNKTTEIASAIKALTPYYEEQAAAALARTEDVRTYVAKMLRGIETLDLYVGKDVSVETIREGASAPRQVPLTLVQKKLLMDEELAVYTDIDELFDFKDVDQFFKAIREHDDLVNQIFPTERCVVVMATTRRHIDYGNVWENASRNKANAAVFLLVRDGWNIHRVFSPVESHLSTSRLFPSQDDQNRPFRGFDGSEIKLDDVAYTDRLHRYEMQALHYKRFLILACGLDHRLKLFGDFYEGPASFDFVSIAFQERYCRFLHDDDGAGLLPGEQRLPVEKWIASRNAYLRSGSRVLCNWHSLMNPKTAPSACLKYRSGDDFELRYQPTEHASVAIAYRDGPSVCVNVNVSGYTLTGTETRNFNCKVNLSKVDQTRWSHTEEAFLCLDAVAPEDLHWYIHNRGARQNHISYIRFFKRALKHVLSERTAETETRRRLAQALHDGQIADGDDALAIVDRAVIAWRAANRGQDLPSFNGEQAPEGWTSLLDQMYLLAGEGERRVDQIADFANRSEITPLRCVASGGAKTILYAAPSKKEVDDRLEPHAWVHRIALEPGKTRMREKSRRWALLPAQAASETTIFEWEEAKEWSGRSSFFTSLDQKRHLFEAASLYTRNLAPFIEQPDEETFSQLLDEWTSVRNEACRESKYVDNPAITIPFGIVLDEYWSDPRFLCIVAPKAHAILYRIAPNDAARENLRKAFIGLYQSSSLANSRFNKEIDVGSAHPEWTIATVRLSASAGRFATYRYDQMDFLTNNQNPNGDPLLGPWFLEWLKQKHRSGKSRRRSWLAEGIVDANGQCQIDNLLGIKRPDDYAPTTVCIVTFEINDAKVVLADLRVSPESPDGNPSLSEDNAYLKLFPGRGSMSRTFHSFITTSRAKDFIERHARESHCDVVAASALPEMPQAPEDIMRWFLVAKAK